MTEIAPLSQVYSVLSSQRVVVPQPAALVDGTEPFASNTGQFTVTHNQSDAQGTLTFGTNVGTVTCSTAAANSTLCLDTNGSFPMPQIFVSVDVTAVSPGSTTYLDVGPGIASDGNNSVWVLVDLKGGNTITTSTTLQVVATISGTFHVLGSGNSPIAGTVQSIGFSLVANSVGVWIKIGGVWNAVGSGSVASIGSFLPTSALSGWRPAFSVWGSTSGFSVSVTNLKWGRFGAIGVRDPKLVTYQDGSPYTPSPNVVYLTLSCSDQTGASYIGLFSFNVSTFALTQVGAIMVSRGGNTQPDVNCDIVLMNDGTVRVITVTWGNGIGGSILPQLTSLSNQAILSGSTVITPSSTLPLPGLTTGSYGAYDPDMYYDAGASLWRLAYTITSNTNFSGNPFYPALATSPDLSTWTLVGADTSRQGYEGTCIYQVNGAPYVTAGGPAGAANSAHVYDGTMTFLGSLNATFNGGSLTQPHAMVFPLGNSFYMFTFDNTEANPGVQFTWGNLILQSAPRYVGATLVPNVYNLALPIASAALVAAGFSVGLVSTKYDALIISGNVDAQNPAGGSTAPAGSAVNLTVSLGVGPVVVPNVLGDTATVANTAVAAVGLVVNAVSYAPSLLYPAGEIIAQNPSGGTAVALGSFVSYVVSSGPPAATGAFDFESTVISQFANSPTIQQLCANMNAYVDQTQNFANFYSFVWNIDTAEGFGLDILGRIVGVSRLLQIPTGALYVGFQDGTGPGTATDVQPFGQQGTWYTRIASSEAYLLDDGSYRKLILTKALSNIVNTTVPAFNQLLQNLFPGRGNPYVTTSGVMAMNFHFDFALTPIELAILEQSGAIPVPPGVSFTITTP